MTFFSFSDRRLGPKSDHEKIALVHSALVHVLCCFPLLYRITNFQNTKYKIQETTYDIQPNRKQQNKQTNQQTDKLLVEPLYCCCTVVTSQPATVDMTATCFSAHRRAGPKSDRIENNSHPVFHACRWYPPE